MAILLSPDVTGPLFSLKNSLLIVVPYQHTATIFVGQFLCPINVIAM